MRKLLVMAVMVVLLSAACNASYADIFGPQPAKAQATEGVSVDPATLLEYLTAAANYLGTREGTFYDFNASEFCNYAGATLYTYEPWNLSASFGLLNADGGAATIDWNVGKVIPCDKVPILSMFKYLYVGAGAGARYIEQDNGRKKWEPAYGIDAQFKATF